ncbi:MAG: hypothetical protein IAF94_23795 [Pirellulaceae bacterium]|nr:hypothetical protein [Pirellulaceae bacterium]
MKVSLNTVGAWVIAGTALLWSGCGSTHAPPADPGKPAPEEHAEHAHPEEGPHGGDLIELGKEEYHAEMTHDDETHIVTIYLLDSAAKASVPVEAKELVVNLTLEGKGVQFKLPALPQESDPEGKSSRFQLADEALCEGICGEKATGRLNVVIADRSYAGTIEHGEHKHR